MKYTNRRRGISPVKRMEILERDLFTCIYCNGDATVVDHVIPYSWSQCDDDDNLVACCNDCNSISGDKIFDSLASKSEYIRTTRKNPKWARRLILKDIPVCSVCGSIFKQRSKGSTVFLCGDCAKIDRQRYRR